MSTFRPLLPRVEPLELIRSSTTRRGGDNLGNIGIDFDGTGDARGVADHTSA